MSHRNSSAVPEEIRANQYLDQYERIIDFDMTPKQIITELDRKVVGQTAAKEALALFARRHYRRVQVRVASGETADLIPKENVLEIGPTGVGKTFLVKTLSEVLSVPFWTDALTNSRWR